MLVSKINLLVIIIFLNNLSFGQIKESSFNGFKWFTEGKDSVYQFDGIDKRTTEDNIDFCFTSAEKYFFNILKINSDSDNCCNLFETLYIKHTKKTLCVEIIFKDINSLINHYISVSNFLDINLENHEYNSYYELNELEYCNAKGKIWEMYNSEKDQSESIMLYIKILELPIASELDKQNEKIKGILILKKYHY